MKKTIKKQKAISLGSPEFKTLEAKWYAKLINSGFEDIEDTRKPDRQLKSWHDQYFFDRHSAEKIVGTRTYYEMATRLLHTFPFKSPMHRRIWELHCDGKTEREIADAISTFKKPLKKSSVHNIIAKIAKAIKHE